MGRRSATGGVTAKGDNRIQFDFTYCTKRYRPTIDQVPTEANLRAARKRLEAIKRRITHGTFRFEEEFPDYKFIDAIAPPLEVPTFRVVAWQFLKDKKVELDFSTFESYRKILGFSIDEMEADEPPTDEIDQTRGFWLPQIGTDRITDIRYSDLTNALAECHGRKTRNNRVSVVRGVFAFAKADRLIDVSPATELKTLKVQKEPPDPYSVTDAELIIAATRDTYGMHDGNRVEYGFFTGLRPSELIALTWPDIDLRRGTTRVNKARVMGRDKERTKTAVVRDIENCPRALAVLKRQWDLTGMADGPVFTHANGQRILSPLLPWRRWQFIHKRLDTRYREPYQMRHTSVTWNLMIGKNLLWVAEQHGHSAAVMLKTYAKWLKGATEEDIARIRRAMGFGTNSALTDSTSGVSK
jgi:integrase